MTDYEATFTLLLDIQLNKQEAELYKKFYEAFINFKEVKGTIVSYQGNLIITRIEQNAEYDKTYSIIHLTNEGVCDKKYPKNVYEVCLNCGSQFITEECEYINSPMFVDRCVNCLI